MTENIQSKWKNQSNSSGMNGLGVGLADDVYFITGATGLMASEFVAQVLTADATAKCYLLVRASSQEKADAKVDRLIDFLFPDTAANAPYRARVQAIMGDMAQPQVGIAAEDWALITQTTHYIVHAAALTDWGADLETATSINVTGVKAIIDLAYACGHKLKRMLHISTAYVSGNKTGTIYPDEVFEASQACDNYQITKMQGETLMRAHWDNLPISIVRPTTVVGNAKNGRTLTYKTFYYPLQILYNGLPLALPVDKHGKLEAVSSDWAAEVMYAILKDAQSKTRCYHLSSGEAVLSNENIRHIVYRIFKLLGEEPKKTHYMPFFIYKLLVAPQVKKLPNGDDIDQKIRLYRHYMTYKRVFDNQATLDIMQQHAINLPSFEQYLPTLMRFAIENKWQRKRQTLQRLAMRTAKDKRQAPSLGDELV